jgi:protein-L-isoaspartate(D-aspartate) O-methyltransferase
MSQDLNFSDLRREMVDGIAIYAQLVGDEIGLDQLGDRVMAAMATVPRHEFVPEALKPAAYLDSALPIGHGKTIAQPFMVALMTDLLEITPDDVVLEIGTGSGYQAAVLAEIAGVVYTVEILDELMAIGKRRLDQQGYRNVHFRLGDGAQGWQDMAPFDKIIVTAAPELVPSALINQLRSGGRMVIPVGRPGEQSLLLIEKGHSQEVRTADLIRVKFGPLIKTH